MVCGGCKDKKDAISYTKAVATSIATRGERRSSSIPINVSSLKTKDGRKVTVTRK